jgi:uncharacterized membrane-anchored protein
MNTPTNQFDQTLWSQLKQSDLVQGEMPITTTADTPWYIRAMQGFAGWIAAFFLLGFFGTVFAWIFDRESAFALIAIGLAGNTIAYALFRASGKNEFLHQLGLVFNLCGQLMVAWGIYEATRSFNPEYFFILFIYQILLVFAVPDFTSRVLTTWFSMFALFAGFSRMGIFNLGAAMASVLFAFVWMNDLKWQKHKNFWEPIGYGLALSMLQFNGQLLFGGEFDWWYQSSHLDWLNLYSYWLSEFLIAAIFIHILLKLVKQYQIKLQSQAGALIIACGLLILLMGYFIIGTSGALLLLLIGFIKQRRLLIGLGMVALLGFISWYYYNLGLTLLTKSIILVGFGLCFLIGFYLLSIYSGGKHLSLDNFKTKYQMNSTKWIAVGSMIVILILVNFNIYKKEQILENGQIVLLELAPVDPRSLMQGDYMRLRFAIESTVLEKNENDDSPDFQSSGYFIVNLDEHNVGTFAAIDTNNTLADNQVKMQFRIRHTRIQLATHAFFFQEGTGAEYEKARYGEFRVNANGELLLNNLRDKSFNILGFNRPSN